MSPAEVANLKGTIFFVGSGRTGTGERCLRTSNTRYLYCYYISQAVMDVVVNPPKPGEPSYDLFIKVGMFTS